MQDRADFRPSLGDRIAIWVYMVAGIAIVAWSGVFAIGRILEISRGAGVPVTIRPIGLELEAASGSGAAVPVQVETATVTVPRLPADAYPLEVLHHAILFAATAIVVVCLLLLARDTLRGRIFGRRSTALVATAGITGLVGYGTVLGLDGAVGGSVLVDLDLSGAEGFVVLVGSPPLFIIAGFALAVILTAYAVGSRIQRETEGLV